MRVRLIDVAALVAIALLGGSLAACGGSSGHVSSGSSSSNARTNTDSSFEAARRRLRDYDGDTTDDPTGSLFDSDDQSVQFYGHAAGVGQRQAIAKVVEHYYAAAADDDGAVACTLIEPSLAKALPEVNDSAPDSPRPSGVSCAAAMSKLLAHVPGRTSGRLGDVEVVAVRVKGSNALVLLRLPNSEVRYIPISLEDGQWRLQALFDIGLV